MRRSCLAAIAFSLAIVAPTGAMARPPTQLYGKSVSYRWMEDIDLKFVDGTSTRSVVSHANGNSVEQK
jgi:hypothetical protein